MSFENLGLDPRLLKGVAAMGYTQPTPIQQQSIPLALAGRDIVGCAQTGTGKTAAFILPILQRLGQGKGIRALVVTPTRELAVQIEEVAQYFGRYTGHRAMAVFGGVGYPGQVKRLRQGVHLLVATPGRLLDMQRRGDIQLGGVSTLVLDEADRMLDMGFWPDVRRIVNSLPTERQTWLFSATMSDQVLSVIGSALKDPQKVEIGRSATPAEAIDQALYPVGAGQKSDLLIELIQQQNLDRILVFTRTKHRADRLCRILGRAGVRSSAIHSNRSQLQRQKALDQFKNGKCSVLVATDIVARGIDVDNISHVINFDLPGNPEDYVHRIGRTARAGTSGTAISFFTGEETAELRAIEGLIKTTLRSEDLEGFIYSSDRTVPNPNREAKKVRRLAYNGGALSGKKRRRPQRSRAMAR